jgi:hypothetical protein
MGDEDDACWICLEGAQEEEELAGCSRGAQVGSEVTAAAPGATKKPPLGPLLQVCACPRRVHASCCARWQLHSAGKR